MTFWKGIEKIEAQVQERKPKAAQAGFISAGRHTLEINYCRMITKSDGAVRFVAQFKTLESDNPEMVVGEMCSYVETFKFDGKINPRTQEKQFPGRARVKQLILAADPSRKEVTPDIIEEIVDDQKNPLAGKKVVCVGNPNENGYIYLNFYAVK